MRMGRFVPNTEVDLVEAFQKQDWNKRVTTSDEPKEDVHGPETPCRLSKGVPSERLRPTIS